MRRWIGVVAGVVVIAALLFTGFVMVRGIFAVLDLSSGSSAGEPDPMFAEPEPPVTRPPALTGEDGGAPEKADDPSRNWVYQTLTPIEP